MRLWSGLVNLPLDQVGHKNSLLRHRKPAINVKTDRTGHRVSNGFAKNHENESTAHLP